MSRKSLVGNEIKSALNSDFKIPLSFKFKAFAARNVIPLRTSAIDNFSKVARIEACVSKSPIGAEPGFQSEAMETQAPASNNFLAGVYCIPKPIDAPGKA